MGRGWGGAAESPCRTCRFAFGHSGVTQADAAVQEDLVILPWESGQQAREATLVGVGGLQHGHADEVSSTPGRKPAKVNRGAERANQGVEGGLTPDPPEFDSRATHNLLQEGSRKVENGANGF